MPEEIVLEPGTANAGDQLDSLRERCCCIFVLIGPNGDKPEPNTTNAHSPLALARLFQHADPAIGIFWAKGASDILPTLNQYSGVTPVKPSSVMAGVCTVNGVGNVSSTRGWSTASRVSYVRDTRDAMKADGRC